VLALPSPARVVGGDVSQSTMRSVQRSWAAASLASSRGGRRPRLLTVRMVGGPCYAAQSATMYGDALRPPELVGALAWSICTEIAAAASLLRVG
jgi:hypothetical protein